MKDFDSHVEERAAVILRQVLARLPFLESVVVQQQLSQQSADLYLELSLEGQRQVLLVEVKASGQPRILRNAVNQLLVYLQSMPGAYGVVFAPYISPRAAAICEEAGVGYADLGGNCRLSFDRVFVDIKGNPNPFKETRELKSLFSPKAERILRVLLKEPGRIWKTEELASEANISIGQVSNVRNKLLREEWAEERKPGFSLTQPAVLLEQWASSYKFERSTVKLFYAMPSVADVEANLAEVCESAKAAYALTSFSGAARYVSFTTYRTVTAYVQGDPDEIAARIGAKPVSSGANVRLAIPYDAGIFLGCRTFDGQTAASPIQSYLDLQDQPSRGQEAAEALLQAVIRPSWQ